MIVVNSRFLTQEITGAQRHALELSRHLRRLDAKIRFVAPKNILHHEIAHELNVDSYGKMRSHMWEQLQLPAYLRKQGTPLLVNLANTAPANYRRQLVTIHDVSFLRHPEWFSRKFYYCYRMLIPRIASIAQKIITDSEFSKREICELLQVTADKVVVIHCGIPENFLAAHKTQRESMCYVLAVSSLDPRKNLQNLLLAFENLQLPGVKLYIVGAKNKVFADQRLSRQLSSLQTRQNIVFTGRVTDEQLSVLYQNAQLFIYPSFYEGFGLPPLEAMSCGCPVIAANAASLPEVCGDAAYYINPASVEDISAAMRRLIEDQSLRNELIAKGKQRVKSFSWHKTASKYLEEFQHE